MRIRVAKAGRHGERASSIVVHSGPKAMCSISIAGDAGAQKREGHGEAALQRRDLAAGDRFAARENTTARTSAAAA